MSISAPKVFIAPTRALARLENLGVLLGAPVRQTVPANRDDAILLAWGRKPSAAKSQHLQEKLKLPLWRVEDGFLRSVGLGNQSPPLSVLVDDCGIYYDATRPSRLETLIAQSKTTEQIRRAEVLIQLWQNNRVSKYNHAREFSESLPERFVLAVDQTAGDASLLHGMADDSSFETMMDAALEAYPDCTVLLKTHPDVVAGRKQSCLAPVRWRNVPRVRILAADCHPPSLMEKAQAVFVVTSQLGFEGLLWGKPVHTFGMPFYAGWGLTTDFLPAPARRSSATLEQLVHAALVEYPNYIHPETAQRCKVEDLVGWMGLQRSMRERFPPVIHAPQFPLANRPILRRFFQGSNLIFRRHSRFPGAPVALWGQTKLPPEFPPAARILRVEDGFLRSVGLGAGLVDPLSWVIDSEGMYYDATRPSQLESILSRHEFSAPLLERAKSLMQEIVQSGLTKYNVGITADLSLPQDRTIILVPGQVEEDQSILKGSPVVRTNLALLQKVRSESPGAFIIYKPHPDVVAGYRKSGREEALAGSFCDLLVTEIAMSELLPKVQEVHTMTSLTGFEALLRGARVHTYGLPFYAGWGLTNDFITYSRRKRKLDLPQLVAGALILYPTYVSRRTGFFTTPEQALREILDWKNSSPTGSMTSLQRASRFVRGVTREVATAMRMQ